MIVNLINSKKKQKKACTENQKVLSLREDLKTRSITVEKNYKFLGEIRKSAEEYNNFYIEIDQKLIESKTTPQNLKKDVENENTKFLKAFEPKTIMKYLGA